MDSYIAAAPSSLISQLDFTIKSTAPYVVQRRSVRMYPSSASSFSQNGVRICRVTLASEGEWLDPSTLRFQMTVNNTDAAKPLQPVSTSANCCWNRLRILVGGTVVDDVLYYNRTAELFQNKLEPLEFQSSEGLLGFACTQFSERAGALPSRHPTPCMIAPNGSLTVMSRLLCGLIRADKLIPLRVCPVTIELTMADANEAFNGDDNHSKSYSFNNACVLCDMITLDANVQNSYMQSLLAGHALAVSIPQYITIYNPMTPGASLASIVVQRALTRLCAVYATFDMVPTATSSWHEVTNFAPPNPEILDSCTRAVNGINGSFTNMVLEDGSFQFQLQLGSKMFPEQAMSSFAEMFESLRKAAGVHNQDIKSLSLDRWDYMSNSFVLGVDLERNLGDPFSAINTRSGDVLRLNFKGITGDLGGCFVHLIGSAILEIREAGSFLFD